MKLTSLQCAAIERALRTLEEKSDYSHPTALIRRVAGADAVKEIRQLHRELVGANEQHRRPVVLSADAQAYDFDVRQLVVLGKRAQRSGSRVVEARVNRMSERLEESFAERVPEEDRPKFLRNEGDGRTWDERWSFMEFRPPLLRREFVGTAFAHPMNVAQRTILQEMVGTPGVEDVAGATERLRRTLKLVRSGE